MLSTEKSLLLSKDPGYPLYAVHVPMGKCYVDTYPADLFFLRFDHFFEIYLMRRLDFTLARLFALHMNYIIRKEKISQIAVADPYYMHEGFLASGDVKREATRKYIKDFMLMKKDKEMILLPYHPSEGRAILIVLYPQVSHALYLNSSKNTERKDYTHIMSVLDRHKGWPHQDQETKARHAGFRP